MPKVTEDQIAQPYVGRPDEVIDFFRPVRTTTQLEDISDEINTVDKRAGRCVFNSTTGAPVWAVGSAAGDDWNDATGLGAHTPV